MYGQSTFLLNRILDVFEKYDKTNIPSEYSDTKLVDLVMYDTVSIACYLSASDGKISQHEADVFNEVFGTERTPDELYGMVTDGDTVLKKIGITFNIIAETEKALGIYQLRKTMIVPLIKFFESFSGDILDSSESHDRAKIYNEFFCTIESALTEIPE